MRLHQCMFKYLVPVHMSITSAEYEYDLFSALQPRLDFHLTVLVLNPAESPLVTRKNTRHKSSTNTNLQ